MYKSIQPGLILKKDTKGKLKYKQIKYKYNQNYDCLLRKDMQWGQINVSTSSACTVAWWAFLVVLMLKIIWNKWGKLVHAFLLHNLTMHPNLLLFMADNDPNQQMKEKVKTDLIKHPQKGGVNVQIPQFPEKRARIDGFWHRQHYCKTQNLICY